MTLSIRFSSSLLKIAAMTKEPKGGKELGGEKLLEEIYSNLFSHITTLLNFF